MGVEDELRTFKKNEYSIGRTDHDVNVKCDSSAELRPRKPDPRMAKLGKQMELIGARINGMEGDQ